MLTNGNDNLTKWLIVLALLGMTALVLCGCDEQPKMATQLVRPVAATQPSTLSSTQPSTKPSLNIPETFDNLVASINGILSNVDQRRDQFILPHVRKAVQYIDKLQNRTKELEQENITLKKMLAEKLETASTASAKANRPATSPISTISLGPITSSAAEKVDTPKQDHYDGPFPSMLNVKKMVILTEVILGCVIIWLIAKIVLIVVKIVRTIKNPKIVFQQETSQTNKAMEEIDKFEEWFRKEKQWAKRIWGNIGNWWKKQPGLYRHGKFVYILEMVATVVPILAIIGLIVWIVLRV